MAVEKGLTYILYNVIKGRNDHEKDRKERKGKGANLSSTVFILLCLQSHYEALLFFHALQLAAFFIHLQVESPYHASISFCAMFDRTSNPGKLEVLPAACEWRSPSSSGLSGAILDIMHYKQSAVLFPGSIHWIPASPVMNG